MKEMETERGLCGVHFPIFLVSSFPAGTGQKDYSLER
jgi:hypothetical protein